VYLFIVPMHMTVGSCTSSWQLAFTPIYTLVQGNLVSSASLVDAGLGASSFIQTDSSTSTMLLGYSYKRVELDRR